jgi:ABC-type multidrug transport system fused ATPase/permease subunit
MSRNASFSIRREGLAGQGVAALWQLAGKSKPGMLQAAGILMVAAAFATGASWVMGTGIDAMVSRNLEESLLYGIAFLAFEALAVALQYLGRRRLAIVTTEVALDTRLALIRKQAVLPMSWFDRQPVGRILTRLTNDVEGIEGFFGGTLARMMIAVIQMVTVFAGLLLVDPRFGAWTVIAALPALVFVFALNAPVRNWLRVFKRRSAHVNSLFAEFVSGISVLRTYSLGAWARGRLGSAVDDQFEAGMKVLHWNSLVRPAAVFLSALPMAFVIFSGGSEVAAGSMTIGTLAVFLRLAERYGTPVRTITQEIQVIQEALSSGERVHEMLVAGETMTNLDRDHDEYPVETTAGQLRAGVNGAVSFRNVSLSYQAGGNGTVARHGAGLKSALHDVTFDVRAGERIGIVGRTGSGKTSLVSLITGLYEPHAGEISIDGVPLARWDKEYLRHQLSFSTQDTVLFRGTLRENLLGFPGSDFEDWKSVEAACRESGLHDLMSADTSGRFDEGLESTVLAGGENFSAGEKQIIALTRALVTRPRILILDEATASVDRRIEDKAMKSITRLLPDCTCFIIAHKYRTLATCDRIFVMDNGKLLADMPPGSEVEIRERLRVMSASAPDLN